MTKTTSDGICADCWGSKGGRDMLVRRGGQTGGSLWEDIVDFFWVFRR